MIDNLLSEIELAEFPEEIAEILGKAKLAILTLRGDEARKVAAIIATRCNERLSQLTPEMHRCENNIKNYEDIRG